MDPERYRIMLKEPAVSVSIMLNVVVELNIVGINDGAIMTIEIARYWSLQQHTIVVSSSSACKKEDNKDWDEVNAKAVQHVVSRNTWPIMPPTSQSLALPSSVHSGTRTRSYTERYKQGPTWVQRNGKRRPARSNTTPRN